MDFVGIFPRQVAFVCQQEEVMSLKRKKENEVGGGMRVDETSVALCITFEDNPPEPYDIHKIVGKSYHCVKCCLLSVRKGAIWPMENFCVDQFQVCDNEQSENGG
ncbi:hypothetical protein BaRGS_00022743 [Batillaria attramentaria]|uniref:Uncharacterized protein n=1 Tax=Batillaria attramentaria TaxID=370345 RepID=A0ABD0KGA7_9CAEN